MQGYICGTLNNYLIAQCATDVLLHLLVPKPYDFEPQIFLWLVFIFGTLVSQILQQHNCSKSLISGQSLFIKHSQGVYFSTQNTKDIVRKRSYRTPPSLSVSRNFLLQKTIKPPAARSVGTGISSFRTVIFCYLYLTQFVHWTHIFCIFIFFSKIFPCSRLLDCSSLIHNLEFSLSEPKNGTI